MSRTFQDRDLLLWEAYAAAPRAGAEHGARIMFHCLSDRNRRARVVERDEALTVIEKRIVSAGEGELVELLRRSEPLD